MERKRPTEQPIEVRLVDRCRRGDTAAFGEVVDAYHARVYGFVRRMVRDDADAEDIAQEVFIRAFQAIERFDGRSGLRTWLFRIAYNLCVDRSRRPDRAAIEQRLDDGEEEPIEFADVRWSPEAVTMTAELAERVEEAIGRMSEKLRTVLLLHDREDLPYEEIAQLVGVPVGTVKSRLFLARNFLQRQLADYLQEQPS